MSTQSSFINVRGTAEQNLDERLETIGWALLLMFTGGIWLVPDGLVPSGTWLVGVGLILLGLNVVRYASGIAMRGLGNILGILALATGLGAFLGVKVPFWPILIILIGAYLIVKPWFQRQ